MSTISYESQHWNNADPTTPLSAPRLNQLETQYADAMADVMAGAKDPSSDVFKAINDLFATNDELRIVAQAAFYNYGVRPRIEWNGTSWPSRATSIPSGYTGDVDYDSADRAGAPSPSDATEGDRWYRQAT